MKLKYDNLEDARTKLVSTYCLYKGKTVTVKSLEPDIDVQGKYFAHAVGMASGRGVTFDIDDPAFNCSEYNIGYLNLMRASAWFYRVPMKQWRQGLRPDQVKMKASQRAFADVNFQSGKGLYNMLENNYPSLEEARELIKAGEANIVAFHKDFAMTYDAIHGDFILEYKGTNIGFTPNFKDLKLMNEHAHLLEALKEAVG